MAQQYVAEFNVGDGFTPQQIEKLNYNFKILSSHSSAQDEQGVEINLNAYNAALAAESAKKSATDAEQYANDAHVAAVRAQEDVKAIGAYVEYSRGARVTLAARVREAQEAADEASNLAYTSHLSAAQAAGAASGALASASQAMDVVGTLNWLTNYGIFKVTEDNEPLNGKMYYELSYRPNSDPGIISGKPYYVYDENEEAYVQVENPVQADIETYLEAVYTPVEVPVKYRQLTAEDVGSEYQQYYDSNYNIVSVPYEYVLTADEELDRFKIYYEFHEAEDEEDEDRYVVAVPTDRGYIQSVDDYAHADKMYYTRSVSEPYEYTPVPTDMYTYIQTVDTEMQQGKKYYILVIDDNNVKIYRETSNEEFIEGETYYERLNTDPAEFGYFEYVGQNPMLDGLYERTVGDVTGLYVEDGRQNPSTLGYYEVDNVGDTVESYIKNHLALLDSGLWLIGDEDTHKINLAIDGTYIYNSLGEIVAKYGTDMQLGAISGTHMEAADKYLLFLPAGITGSDYDISDPDQKAILLSQAVAYIDIDENGESVFYITRSVVVKDMFFGEGKWKWYKRSNNNMSLKWMGDS